MKKIVLALAVISFCFVIGFGIFAHSSCVANQNIQQSKFAQQTKQIQSPGKQITPLPPGAIRRGERGEIGTANILIGDKYYSVDYSITVSPSPSFVRGKNSSRVPSLLSCTYFLRVKNTPYNIFIADEDYDGCVDAIIVGGEDLKLYANSGKQLCPKDGSLTVRIKTKEKVTEFPIPAEVVKAIKGSGSSYGENKYSGTVEVSLELDTQTIDQLLAMGDSIIKQLK